MHDTFTFQCELKNTFFTGVHEETPMKI